MNTQTLAMFWFGWMIGLFFIVPFVGAFFTKPKEPDWAKWRAGGIDEEMIGHAQVLFNRLKRDKTYMIRAGDIMRSKIHEGIQISLFAGFYAWVVA